MELEACWGNTVLTRLWRRRGTVAHSFFMSHWAKKGSATGRGTQRWESRQLHVQYCCYFCLSGIWWLRGMYTHIYEETMVIVSWHSIWPNCISILNRKKAARDQIISAHLSSAKSLLIGQYPSNEHVTCKKNVACSDAIGWFDWGKLGRSGVACWRLLRGRQFIHSCVWLSSFLAGGLLG